MNQVRPLFKNIKNYNEFIQYYWYKEELQKICKEYGIDHIGSKQELNHVIEEYFKGNIIKPQKRVSVKKQDIELTLETKLLESGFAMRNEYREFFGKQVGVKNFKFTADMGAAIKKVRLEKNKDFTVKDFCKDSRNDIYTSKHKVASILWKKLRLSTDPKVYTYELIEKYSHEIKEYKK